MKVHDTQAYSQDGCDKSILQSSNFLLSSALHTRVRTALKQALMLTYAKMGLTADATRKDFPAGPHPVSHSSFKFRS